MNLAQTLGYNYVFRGLPSPVVQGLAAMAEVRTYRGGDTLIRQFDRNNDLIIILEGGALVKTFGDERLTELGPGSMIGEISLIDEQPRSATVVAKGDTTAAVFDANNFRAMMETDPATAATILSNICRVLCRRLRSMNIQLDGMGE
jgi:CRP-like cAMP-binding protein